MNRVSFIISAQKSWPLRLQKFIGSVRSSSPRKDCFTLAARPSPTHRGWHLYQFDGNYEIHTAEMILYSMVSLMAARRREVIARSSRHLPGSAARYVLCALRLRPLLGRSGERGVLRLLKSNFTLKSAKLNQFSKFRRVFPFSSYFFLLKTHYLAESCR